MATLDDLVRYDGRHVVVTGCASGIGAQVARQLGELGAHVIGLDRRTAADTDARQPISSRSTWPTRPPIDAAAGAVDGPVDALFNVAGVSSGIGDPLLVVTINFLGMRQFTEALIAAHAPRLVDRQRVLAGGVGVPRERKHHCGSARHRDRSTAGHRWCDGNPDALADGGYRLSKEAIILYGMANAGELGARGIRINCTGTGRHRNPDPRPTAVGLRRGILDSFPTPLGRVVRPPRSRRRRWCS